jgi:hypothetical protein
MRKKSDTVGVSRGIVKATQMHTSKKRTIACENIPTQEKNVADGSSPQLCTASHIQSDVYDELGCISAPRSRSTTPQETDLLRYLTAHIKQPDVPPGGSLCLDITSFVIGRDEYLQGIIKLIQADCPEVVDSEDSFMVCIREAFLNVKRIAGM